MGLNMLEKHTIREGPLAADPDLVATRQQIYEAHFPPGAFQTWNKCSDLPFLPSFQVFPSPHVLATGGREGERDCH